MIKFVKNILFIVIIISFSLVINAVNSQTEKEKQYYFPKITSENQNQVQDKYLPPPPIFPSFGAIPTTSKFKTTIDGRGQLGALNKNPFNGIPNAGFEFPKNSGVSYLWGGALWVGGIIGDDTLVSVGFSKENWYDSTNNYFYFANRQEFFPPDFLDSIFSTYQTELDSSLLYHTSFVDTFTDSNLISNSYYFSDENHNPMNLKISLSSYTKNKTPYKNILLLDYTITNKNQMPIQDAYVGIYLDADINRECNIYGVGDDLAGSFRDKGYVYFIDNDGELSISGCTSERPDAALALKPLASFPQAIDTNYNWWAENWTSYDFGPRKKGTIENPFREFGYGVFAVPTADRNKYYLLKNKEWDFDQYLTNKLPYEDTTWITFDRPLMMDIANGKDVKSLLSMGPYQIDADSSIRIIFGLFIGDLVHIVDTNLNNLFLENYDEYYDNLHFEILDQNANFTENLLQEYLSPLNQPLGLTKKYFSFDSVHLKWDPFVIPDVSDYNIYIKELPDSLVIKKSLPRVDITFEEIPTIAQMTTTSKNYFTFTDLSPDKIYSIVVSQNSHLGESIFSKQLYINHDNPKAQPRSPKPKSNFTPYLAGQNKVIINWNKVSDTTITHYKIYKSTDSVLAHLRSEPFMRSLNIETPIFPKFCKLSENDVVCYYYQEAFDSVDASINQYLDYASNDETYYWITSVNNLGFESDFSTMIKPIVPPLVSKDILVVFGSTSHETDYIYRQSIINYYFELLEKYNYDIVDWKDTEQFPDTCINGKCVDLEEFGQYKLIIIEEFPSPKILTTSFEENSKLLTKLSDIGYNIAYFGIPPASKFVSLSSHTDVIEYADESFEKNYMGINSTSLIPWLGNYTDFNVKDTLGGFNSAISLISKLNTLELNPDNSIYKSFLNELFDLENNLPYTPIFNVEENTNVLYKYHSLFPESSELHNYPVGIAHKNLNSTFYTFGFHLPSIDKEDAINLIRYLFNEPNNHPSPIVIPKGISLSQNYPNPFNGLTSISFSLELAKEVSLNIYNILGQKVSTILNSSLMSSGHHIVQWDGKNEENIDVASGIYFYKLEVEDETVTKKMVFLK